MMVYHYYGSMAVRCNYSVSWMHSPSPGQKIVHPKMHLHASNYDYRKWSWNVHHTRRWWSVSIYNTCQLGRALCTNKTLRCQASHLHFLVETFQGQYLWNSKPSVTHLQTTHLCTQSSVEYSNKSDSIKVVWLLFSFFENKLVFARKWA